VAGKVAHDLAAAGGVPDVDGVLEIEMGSQRSQSFTGGDSFPGGRPSDPLARVARFADSARCPQEVTGDELDDRCSNRFGQLVGDISCGWSGKLKPVGRLRRL
jgi:hypothetical protein